MHDKEKLPVLNIKLDTFGHLLPCILYLEYFVDTSLAYIWKSAEHFLIFTHKIKLHFNTFKMLSVNLINKDSHSRLETQIKMLETFQPAETVRR